VRRKYLASFTDSFYVKEALTLRMGVRRRSQQHHCCAIARHRNSIYSQSTIESLILICCEGRIRGTGWINIYHDSRQNHIAGPVAQR